MAFAIAFAALCTEQFPSDVESPRPILNLEKKRNPMRLKFDFCRREKGRIQLVERRSYISTGDSVESNLTRADGNVP